MNVVPIEFEFGGRNVCARDIELKLLRDSYERACSRSSQVRASHPEVVFISGEPGTGKSALIDSFARWLGQNNTCFVIQCKFDEDSKEGSPFAAIGKCFDAIVDTILCQKNEEEKWKKFLREDVGEFLAALSTISPRLREWFAASRGQEGHSLPTSRGPHESTSKEKAGASEKTENPQEQSKGLSSSEHAGLYDLEIKQLQGSHHGSGGSVCSVSSCFQDAEGRRQFGFDRLRIAVRGFVRRLSALGPIVLATEDLHLADTSSWHVIKTILVDKRCNNLLCIGTYRPFAASDLLLPHVEGKIRYINLKNLDVEGLTEMLSLVLRREVDQVRDLGEILHRKTDGNPFFVRQLLLHLRDRNLLYFSIAALKIDWHLDRIQKEANISDNVLALLRDKIERLDPKLQFALKGASCLSIPRFDTGTLFLALQAPQWKATTEPKTPFPGIANALELEKILKEGVAEGLLDRMESSEKYRFVDDRVRDLFCRLLPKGLDLIHLHASIGRLLREELESNSDELASEELLVLTVNHLNRGLEAVEEADDFIDIVKLNYRVAELNFERCYFFGAVRYLEAALHFLDRREDKWDAHYQVALNLTSTLAHDLFCCGRLDESIEYVKEVQSKARTEADKLRTNRILVLCLVQQTRLGEAKDVIRQILNNLGHAYIPKRCLKLYIVAALLRVKTRLDRITNDDILKLPHANDWTMDASLDFLTLLAEISIMSADLDLQLYSTICIADISLLREQRHECTTAGLASIAFLFSAMGDMKSANRYANLSMELTADHLSPSYDARAILAIHFFVRHRLQYYHQCLEPPLQALKMSEAHGDIEYLFLGAITYSALYLWSGMDLRPIDKDMNDFLEKLGDYKQAFYVALYQPLVQFVQNLMGKSDNPLILTGDAMDQAECLTKWKESRNLRALSVSVIVRMILGYYLEDLEYASAMSSELVPEIIEGPSPFRITRLFFQGMIYFGLSRQKGKLWYKTCGKKFIRKLEKYYKLGDVNCFHKLLLLRAECDSLDSKIDCSCVQKAFDEAIVAAGRLGFTSDQALANFRAGVFFLDRDKEWATIYMTRAFELFTEWGGIAIANHIKTKYRSSLDLGKMSLKRHSSALLARPRLQGVGLGSTEIFTGSE